MLAPRVNVFVTDAIKRAVEREERKVHQQIVANTMGLSEPLVDTLTGEEADLEGELRALLAASGDPKIKDAAREALEYLTAGSARPELLDKILTATRELAAHDKQRRAMTAAARAPRPPANRHERRAAAARARRKP